MAITGGARGIGRATAAAAARAGARVAIGDLDAELAAAAAAELGGEAIGIGLDVTDRESFTRFLDASDEHLGPLDVLVNNAGIMLTGAFEDEPPEWAERMLDVNVRGVIIGSQLAVQRMVPRRRGHLVNIASIAGRGGFPGVATYCATKYAVVGLSEALDAELRDTGVAVSVIEPAVVHTELTSGVDEKAARRMRGLCEPEDVADAIVATLREPRFEVIVPQSAGRTLRFMSMLPRRWRLAIGRTTGADRTMLDTDPVARRAYLERAAGPAALPPGTPDDA